ERDRLVVAALGLPEHPPHEGGDQDDQDYVRQQDDQQVRVTVVVVELDDGLGRVLGAPVVAAARAVRHCHVVLGAVVVGGDGVGALHLDRLDTPVVDVREEGGVRPLVGV